VFTYDIWQPYIVKDRPDGYYLKVSGSALTKAHGVRINLWVGLAMLALGLLFLSWQWARPVRLGPQEDGEAPAADRRTGPE
jgi:hypothetical protein